MEGSKNGKQKYRVRINYTDNFGKNRQIDRVAYGNAEAKDLERQLESELREKTPTARMTVRQLYDEYVKAITPELRESSLDNNKRNLKAYVLELLGDTALDKLTAPVIQQWKNDIESKRVKSAKRDEAPLSLRTKQNIFSAFRALLNWGIKMDYLSQNILSKVGNFKSSDFSKKEMDFYTADEYKSFSEIAQSEAKKSGVIVDWDFYVFFSIAFYTGLRKGEIHALKWSDIKGDYLNITRSITQKLKGEDRETPPKNKSSVRTLQMPLPLINILKEHKKRYKQHKGFSEDFRICGGPRSLRDTSVENANIKFAKLAGLKKIRIHDFRHSHVSLLANEGINIQEIARRLGHAKIEMTWNTYSHLYPREEERAVEILNKIV
jgi:integrase